MREFYNKHYITVNDGRIIKGFSDAFKQPQDGDICINEQGGYQFRLEAGGEENPPLTNFDGIPLYKYADGVVCARKKDEIEADKSKIPELPYVPSSQDKINASLMAEIATLKAGAK